MSQLYTPVANPIRTRAPRLTMVVAAVGVLVIAARISLPAGLTAGLAVTVLTLPIWAPVLKRSVAPRVLLVLGVIAVVSGVWLTAFASQDHGTSVGLVLENTFLLLGILLGACFVLWARTVIGTTATGIVFALGMLLGVRPDSELFATNPWRFGFSIAITVLVLAVLQSSSRRWLSLLAVLALTGVSAVTDARSSFAILLLTAIATAWQSLPRLTSGRPHTGAIVAVFAAIGVAVYNFGQSLILDGFLGETTRLRTLEQVETSGSLLLGGRPELTATLALFWHRPFGFGSGTVPTLDDILVAKTGMASINYQPNNNYVENYMFGGKFEVHSIIGDLWAAFGIPGIVLCVAIVVLLLHQVLRRIALGTASALVLYLTVKSIWSVAFSPLLSSAVLLILVLGLVMPLDEDRDEPALAPPDAVEARA